MNIFKATTAIASSLCLMACAKHANEIQPQYISPMQYQSYSCKQLEMEMQSLSHRVQEVGGVVENTAQSDDMEMGVGLVLLWPTLFFLDGDTPQAAEYARLKGEFDALEKAAIKKECGFKIERPKLPEKPVDNSPKYGERRHAH
ncbi:MAG: hypothetical protein ACOYJ2_05830 [Rickettsiales bacterium]